jgi:predicted phosphohydrolase
MRVICLSDTHELHREVLVPDGDLLIHAGDFTFFSKRPSMLRDFNRWLGELQHRHKVVVPGNHDYLLENASARSLITNANLLMDSGATIEGIHLWGSPATLLPGGAFCRPDAADRRCHWARIPIDTDILITHSPACGILDGAPNSDQHEGDPELLAAFERVRPILHVCGHVHEGYGSLWKKHTCHVNAALLDQELGGVERNPIVMDFELLRMKSQRNF